MRTMKLGTKIALGFGLLIFIAMLLGGLSVYEMNKIDKESAKLAKEYVPEVNLATRIRGAANRIMYEMRGYGFTEKKSYYDKALEEMKAMDDALGQADTLEKEALHLVKLKDELKSVRSAKKAYADAAAETDALVGTLAEERTKLDANATAYMEASGEFLEGQTQKAKVDLRDRLQKIQLVNDLVNLGTQARVRNFKAQAMKNPVLMEEVLGVIAGVKEVTEKMRPLTKDEEDIRSIKATEKAAEGYGAAVKNFLAEFKKGDAASPYVLQDLRKEMDENANAYVSNCEDFFISQQSKLEHDILQRLEKITLGTDIMALGDDTRIKAFKSQALRDPEIMKSAQDNFPRINEKFEAIRRITFLEEDLNRISSIQKAADGYSAAMGRFLEKWVILQNLGETRNELGKNMIDSSIAMADAGLKNTDQIANLALDTLSMASKIMVIGLIVAFFVGAFLAFFITRELPAHQSDHQRTGQRFGTGGFRLQSGFLRQPVFG